jgi:putative ABC transport system ATP-binding protein
MCIMNDAVIHLHSLRHRLAPGVFFMLDELCVAAGESVALTGPSGCGKSTLLNLMAGLTRLQAGSVRVLGTEVGSLGTAALDQHRGRHIGMVFQSFHLLGHFTALENVQIGLRFSRRSGNAVQMLERVGLAHRQHTRVNRLSIGERQRVAIARALVGKPEILLADEPTGSLDPKTGRQVFDLMRELVHEHSTTFLMVTHDLALAKELPRQFDCSTLIRSEEVYQ